MTLDLAKIKSDAEKIAANSDLLLMALPVKYVLAMVSEIDRLAFEPAAHSRRLIDQLKAENEALRNGVKGDYDLDAWLSFVEEEPQLRKDAERYRWLRDGGYLHSFVSIHPCDEHKASELTDQAVNRILEFKP